MTYICLDCGHIFEEGEQGKSRAFLGECHGKNVYEEEKCCPICGGDYEEAFACEICGTLHYKDNLCGGACDRCINEYRYDINTCYDVAKKMGEEQVELNCFLASIFTKDEIENILFKELKNAEKFAKVNCDNFINADREWFAELIIERGGKCE